MTVKREQKPQAEDKDEVETMGATALLSFDKVALHDQTFLSFFAKVGNIASQSLTLHNEGSTSVYFQWMKEMPNKPFSFEPEDHEDYFHIHNVGF